MQVIRSTNMGRHPRLPGRRIGASLTTIAVAGTLFAGAAQQPGTPAHDDADVCAADCRVTFVDRRTLSVERPGILSNAVREGAWVEVGQVVIRVRDAVPMSALAVAAARADSDADLRSARKEHEAAEFELQTHLKARPGTYTDVEIRRVQLAAESAALKVEQAAFEREVNQRLKDQAADELGTYYVPSTISGLVTRAFKGPGEAVQLGEPIVEVVNTDRVRIEGYVTLEEAWRVRVGMAVTVEVDLAGTEAAPAGTPTPNEARLVILEGTLGFVDVDVQPVSKVVRVWAELPNPAQRLRDGLPVRAMVIHTEEERPVAATKE